LPETSIGRHNGSASRLVLVLHANLLTQFARNADSHRDLMGVFRQPKREFAIAGKPQLLCRMTF